jgi:type I site-specific restriction-modification system R (restriction) subunit
VVLEQRLRDALARLNPDFPAEALQDAFRKLTRPEGATPEQRNRALHRMLVDGVTVEYRREDGSIAGAQARILDFNDPESNDWLAVNQFTVSENRHTRRPDVVLFVNGLPLAVIELKNPADEQATIWSAYQQLQTYKHEIPSLFASNEALVISDGLEARIGVIWHTQGSGKSLTMVFYAGRIIRHPQMEKPTIVVLTDRNDLDGQLLGVFSSCRDLLVHRFRSSDATDTARRIVVLPVEGPAALVMGANVPHELVSKAAPARPRRPWSCAWTDCPR